MRACLVGSGSEGLQQPEVCETILKLCGNRSPESITALYIGTATYDLAGPKTNQTKLLAAAGCTITELKCAKEGDSTYEEAQAKVEAADIIIISGGNTLYATDRWHQIGLVPLLTAAKDRNCVLTGTVNHAAIIYHPKKKTALQPLKKLNTGSS